MKGAGHRKLFASYQGGPKGVGRRVSGILAPHMRAHTRLHGRKLCNTGSRRVHKSYLLQNDSSEVVIFFVGKMIGSPPCHYLRKIEEQKLSRTTNTYTHKRRHSRS